MFWDTTLTSAAGLAAGLASKCPRLRLHNIQERPGDLPGDLQEAERRADNLLRGVLTKDEYQQMTRQGYLEVHSPSIPQRVYRVPWRFVDTVRVKVYEEDRLIMYLCVQPVKFLPSGDVVVMHKLSIEGNEDQYLKLANRWYSSPSAGTYLREENVRSLLRFR